MGSARLHRTGDWDRYFGSDKKFNHMRGNEWLHIMMQCEAGKGFSSGGFGGLNSPVPAKIMMWVNGRILKGTDMVLIHAHDSPKDFSIIHGVSLRRCANMLPALLSLADGAYQALAFEGKRRKDKGGGAVEPNFGPSGAMANSKAARRWAG